MAVHGKLVNQIPVDCINVYFLIVILCYRNARCHHWGNWVPGISLLFLLTACESALAQNFSRIYKEKES